MKMLIDELLTIDWANPAIRKALPLCRSNGGSLSWHCGETKLASLAFTWNATTSIIALRYAIDGARQVQRIRVVETTPQFGGTRRWFWCEHSKARTRILVLPATGVRWLARAACPAAYRSQRVRRPSLRALIVALRRSDARLRRNAIRRLLRRERVAEGPL